MDLRFFCPQCSCFNKVLEFQEKPQWECPSCKRHLLLPRDPELIASGALTQCLVCGKNYFYNRPLFHKGLGCAIVLIAIVLSIWTYGISLIVAGLIDWFLFRRLPRSVVCYVCDTEYLGTRTQAPEFDLHLHEKYRKYRDAYQAGNS